MEHISNIEDIYKLSPMQQGMLFHTLYAPESGVYREQTSCSLKGNLNVSAFQQAWGQVVQRHPILRTAFYWEELSEPLQVVQRQVELSWEQRDWRGLSSLEQQGRLEAFLEADRARGFDLGQAPLMRCALLREAEDAYRFVLGFHHLLFDGWSLSLLLKEVLAFYEAYCRGRELRLESPRPYRDYIVWLQQQDLAQAEGFWREALRGMTAPTPLPLGRSEGARLESRYAEQELRVSAALSSSIAGAGPGAPADPEHSGAGGLGGAALPLQWGGGGGLWGDGVGTSGGAGGGGGDGGAVHQYPAGARRGPLTGLPAALVTATAGAASGAGAVYLQPAGGDPGLE